jgi:threonine dehydrogenase-like Zn-dependent dehydrogenase
VNRTIRQIVFPSQAKASLVTRDVPVRALADNDVAGATISSVISAGTELGMQYLSDRDFPHEPGYGAVFRVEEVGKAVTDLIPGAFAFCIGKHQSWQSFPRDQVVPLPPMLDPAEGSIARMIAIAKANLTLCEARPPARVIVSGLGAVGHYAARLFMLTGYKVAGVDPDRERRELVGLYGVGTTFAAMPEEHPDWRLAADLVLECSGDEKAVYDACCTVRPGGEVRLVGVSWRPRHDFPVQSMLRKIFWRKARLHSGWEWELPWLPAAKGQGCYRDNVVTILSDMASGATSVKGLYSTAAPSDCQTVYDRLCHERTRALSTVFVWDT